MNIQQFNYILAVAEHRHFETAAEKCNVTQSTLSTMISKLEDEIGITIFNRRKKPVEITEEGNEIIDRLKIITSEIDQLVELTKELKGEISGKIRIGCIPTVAPYLLPLFLNDFSAKYPDLHIEIKEITTDEIIRSLKTRELDIGIDSPPLIDAELVEIPLFTEPFMLFNTGKNRSENVIIEELNWANFWILEESHCMTGQVIDICRAYNAHIDSSPNISFKAGSIGSLIRFVKSTGGKTILPYLAAINLPEEDKDYLSRFNDPVPFRTIGLAVHQHFAKKKILELLKKEIIEKIIPVLGEFQKG